MQKIAVSLLLLFVLLPGASVRCAEEQATGESQPRFPGVVQVVPRASQLADESQLAKNRIASLREPASLQPQFETSRQQLVNMKMRMAELSSPFGWGFDQMLELRGDLTDEKVRLSATLDGLSARLTELEEIDTRWRDKKAYWKGWRTALQDTEIGVAGEEFSNSLATIDAVLKQAGELSEHLVPLQKEAADLLAKASAMLSQVDDLLHRQTFKKVSFSFASREYLAQFDSRLWLQVKSGFSEVEGVSSEFFRQQGWVVGLQFVVAIILAAFIIHQRPKVEETEEWRFILRHPGATAIFAALSSLSFLYAAPPAPWRLLLWLLAASSASILICALLKNPRKRFMVGLLATLFVLSLALQEIAFPSPLYRLYLALLSLVGIPLFLLMAASNRRAHDGQLTGFTVSLQIGSAVLLVSFLAQFGGYSTLSFRLIESSIKTVFLGLFAAMVVKLGQGGIAFLLDQQFLRRWRFFRRFGNELTTRLSNLFLTLVVAYSILYLTEIWYIYDSVADALAKLLRLGFTYEETEITVKHVLVIGLVLYAAIVSSWVIRSVLEAEFFPRRRFDRGVRDSIKKLLHYILITLGFIFAMSMAGVELRNFAVLAGAFGIGIGFGLQNIVNNFVSGLILLFERPIKIGDMLVIDNEWGTVRKIGLRSTVVTTLDESEIIVPNSVLVAEKVTNWSLSSNRCRLVIPVGIAYGSDVPLVLKILVEAGMHNEAVLEDPPPSPLFRGFGNSSLDFELRIWISDVRDRQRVLGELCQDIDQRFREAGVEIPFPQRDLHVRSVDSAVIRDLGEHARPTPKAGAAKKQPAPKAKAGRKNIEKSEDR